MSVTSAKSRVLRSVLVGAVMAGAVMTGAVATATTSSAAPDYVLDASGIEQTVLRAQMPKGLGSWNQNLYFASSGAAPVVCWSSKGSLLTLPTSKSGGSVGYQVDQGTSGAVMIYQYSDAAAAASALKALQSTVCPNSPKVGLDSGDENLVPASSGSDFTSSEEDSLVVSTSYKDGGVQQVSETITTQVGLAVVQTQVFVSGKQLASQRIEKAHDLNAKWHAQVVKAYKAFGSGGSR